MFTQNNKIVFSTCVEVILLVNLIKVLESGILHVCGGDPFKGDPFAISRSVFSTCVEVILLDMLILELKISILHVCGGDHSSLAL